MNHTELDYQGAHESALYERSEALYDIAWRTSHNTFVSASFALDDLAAQLDDGLTFAELIEEIECISAFGDRRDQEQQSMKYISRLQYEFSQYVFDAWLDGVFGMLALDPNAAALMMTKLSRMHVEEAEMQEADEAAEDSEEEL
jgi:hypothetical protein